jgi:ribA/ribD-fused uncharacterized protein
MNYPTEIREFHGDWGFLSNFYPCSVTLDGVVYESVEHAYQAAKTLNLTEREKFLYAGVTAGRAKRMGGGVTKRPDWETVKVDIMRDLLMQKFYPTILRRKLLCTFSANLVEGNWWHDIFWGVCEGTCKEGPHEPTGENWLGLLLMEIRRHYGKL